jgi:regulation of enolase protein 1 (concanavalin A-like superfamily)
VEYTDGIMHFSTVVTNDHSDWSVVALTGTPPKVGARITRLGDALFIQYSVDDGKSWSMARLAWFPASPDTVEIGMMACSPKRGGFQVEFFDFKLGEPVSRDIH